MNGGIEILNIGPMELVFILAMMILFLGPKDMARLARQAGAWIRSIRSSSLWNDIMKVDREIRDLPVQLAREAGFEEQMEEIRRSTQIPPLDINPIPAADPAEESSIIPKTPGEVRSPGSRLRPPMRRGTPPPPRTETPADDTAAQQAEPVEETEHEPKQETE